MLALQLRTSASGEGNNRLGCCVTLFITPSWSDPETQQTNRADTPMKRNAAIPSVRASHRIPFVITMAVLLVALVFSASPVWAEDGAAAKILIFRNIPSWDRTPDFEDACQTLKLS